MSEHVQQAVDAYFAAVAALDADAFVAVFAPGAVTEDPYGAPPNRGEEGLRGFIAGIRENFREMVLAPDDTFIRRDRAAVVWTGRGVAHDGTEVTYRGIDVFTVDDDGRITSLVAYWDPRSLFAQLPRSS